MKLNPLKCKEILINFTKYPKKIIQPICIGNRQLERVSIFKFLGLKIIHYLKLKDHIDYIIFVVKPPNDLYTLRVCKRAGVTGSNIINILSAPSDRYLNMLSWHGKIFQSTYLSS